jgi:hypothetical protein
MNIEELKSIDACYRSEKPKLFMLCEPDSKASSSEIMHLEGGIGCSLPESYAEFLEAFGGGMYGFVNIFSADPSSEWFLLSKLKKAKDFGLPDGLIPFSEDYAGGYYVFKRNGGAALGQVYYWNLDGGVVATEYGCVLEFVSRYAYEPA